MNLEEKEKGADHHFPDIFMSDSDEEGEEYLGDTLHHQTEAQVKSRTEARTMALKPEPVQDSSKDQVKLQNIEFQEGWVKNRTERDSLQKEGRYDSVAHDRLEDRMRTMKITSKILLDIVREERRNVQVLETKLDTFNKEVEDEEYSRESKQSADKAADTSREEKIEGVNELERKRIGVSTFS